MHNHHSSIKVNICSWGEPDDPKTWSGTPNNIRHALASVNACGITFDSQIKQRFLRFCLFSLSCLLFGRKDIPRGPILRYFSSLKVWLKLRKNASSHTLHTGTSDLPFIFKPRLQRHYLYVDSTWSIFSKYSTDIQQYSPRQLRLFDALEYKSYSQVDHIFTTGHFIKDNLVSHYNVPAEKISVVGTGLGGVKPFFGEKNYSNKKILFTAKGRFKDKGGELVVKAFEHALKKDPELQMTIVGCQEGTLYGNHPNITTLGFIDQEQLQSIFETHSLFIMPALYEPWGLVYLEAMGCKMPIMGLDRNSFPELSGYGKHGFVIKDTNPAVVGDALVAAFKNPENLRQMGEDAQAYCLKTYSWQNVASKIVDTIATCYK